MAVAKKEVEDLNTAQTQKINILDRRATVVEGVCLCLCVYVFLYLCVHMCLYVCVFLYL